MRKFLSGVIMVLATYFIVSGLWAIDISVSAMNTGGVVTNGYWIRDWITQYHHGLWLVGVSFMSIVGVCLYNIHRDEK